MLSAHTKRFPYALSLDSFRHFGRTGGILNFLTKFPDTNILKLIEAISKEGGRDDKDD
jgi:hypothetical protein